MHHNPGNMFLVPGLPGAQAGTEIRYQSITHIKLGSYVWKNIILPLGLDINASFIVIYI